MPIISSDWAFICSRQLTNWSHIHSLFLNARLSGLSPFMGDSDLETMANVTRANYDFDDEAFDVISDEAKDFIEKLLLKDPE